MYISVGVCSTVGRGGEGWGKGTSPLPPPIPLCPSSWREGAGYWGGGGEVQSYTACPTVNALDLPHFSLQHSHTQIETDSDEG